MIYSFINFEQVTYPSFKRTIRFHQYTDHLRGKLFPQNTPQRNQYVKGMIVHQQRHNCLGKMYSGPDVLNNKRKRRSSVRKKIGKEDIEDPEIAKIVSTALKMDTAKFNSFDGPPPLTQSQLTTTHQLLGYAIRRVAGELHIYLRSPIPSIAGPVKRLQWKILRTMTIWDENNNEKSQFSGLTDDKEKKPGRLVRFKDQVRIFLLFFCAVMSCQMKYTSLFHCT